MAPRDLTANDGVGIKRAFTRGINLRGQAERCTISGFKRFNTFNKITFSPDIPDGMFHKLTGIISHVHQTSKHLEKERLIKKKNKKRMGILSVAFKTSQSDLITTSGRLPVVRGRPCGVRPRWAEFN